MVYDPDVVDVLLEQMSAVVARIATINASLPEPQRVLH